MRECLTDGVDLSEDEVRHLDLLPDAAHEVKSPLECELEADHAGPHVSLAQAADRGADGITNWWLRWTVESRKWTHEATCYTENADGSELCLLPANHEGVHSWD